MSEVKSKVSFLHSLKLQLCTGAIALLGVTVASISYFLIEHQKRILLGDLQDTIVLQGRNVAMGSVKGLLGDDPEFELLPLVTRITEHRPNVTSLIIVDSKNTIRADLDVQNISTPMRLDVAGYEASFTDLMVSGEQLYENNDSFLLKTPILSRGKLLGHVYMRYSTQVLADAIGRAVAITLACGLAAFILGILLSLLLFQKISQPMDVMMEGVQALGRGELDTRIELPTRNEFRVLATSFNEMAGQLLDAQRELVEKHLLDRELEIAHRIQDTLMPAVVNRLDRYDIATYHKSAMQVGGDYVDVIKMDAFRTAFVIADVSGKGIPGLVVSAMLKIMVQELLKTRQNLSFAIRQLNESLAANIGENMFVTMVLAILDSKTSELTYVNAAHTPTLIYRHETRRSEFDRTTGRPLAFFPDSDFHDRIEERKITLEPSDLFLLYTDGLIESRNPNRKPFGYDRVADICDRHAVEGAKQLIQRLVDAETDFRGSLAQSDDLTLLAIRATSPESSSKELVGAKLGEQCS